jgi:hypothetical protein
MQMPVLNVKRRGTLKNADIVVSAPTSRRRGKRLRNGH